VGTLNGANIHKQTCLASPHVLANNTYEGRASPHTSCSIPQLSFSSSAGGGLLAELFGFRFYSPVLNMEILLLFPTSSHSYLLLTRYYFSASSFFFLLDKFTFTKMTAKSGLKIFLLHSKNVFLVLKFLCEVN